jgi:Flp pilus assembly protein TadG
MSRNLKELMMKHSPLTKLSAKNNPRREAGSSLFEFGLAFPVLMLILLGTADFGRIFYTYVTLSSAAHTGAEYGATSAPKIYDSAGIQRAALNDAQDLSGVTVTSTPSCQCSNGSAVNCAATSCSPLRYYISVSAKKTFQTLIPYPGIPSSTDVTAVAVLRAQ